jgi:hypothetical protein
MLKAILTDIKKASYAWIDKKGQEELQILSEPNLVKL